MLGQAWTVRIASEARSRVEAFLAADCSRERGGFLLGRFRTQDRRATFVERALPCPRAPATAASLTLRAEEWQLLHEDEQVRSGGQAVVGWFHSHPSMPVDMSERDRFIQRHFFAHPLHVAWIRDPAGGDEAIWGLLGDRPIRLPTEDAAS